MPTLRVAGKGDLFTTSRQVLAFLLCGPRRFGGYTARALLALLAVEWSCVRCVFSFAVLQATQHVSDGC